MSNKSKAGLNRRINGLCKCGASLSTDVPLYLNINQPECLKRLGELLSATTLSECPSCGERHEIYEPLAVDLPNESTLCVLVPPQLAYRAFSCLGEVMGSLGAAKLLIKPYFARAELIIGAEALRRRISANTSGDQLAPVSGEVKLSQSVTKLDRGVGGRGLTPLPFPRGSALQPRQTPNPLSAVTSPLPQNITSADSQKTINVTLAREIAEAQTKVSRLNLEASRSEEPIGGLDSLLDSALGEGEGLTSISELNDGGLSDFHRADTAVVSEHEEPASAVTHNFTPRASSKQRVDLADTHELYTPNTRLFDPQAARGNTRYITLKEDRIELAAKIDERYAERWITGELDVRLQLHMIDQHGAPCLTLYTLEEGEVQDELYWPIQVDDQRGPKILRALRKRFRLELTLFKKNNNFYGQRLIEAPLEENAAYIINHIKKMRMTHSAAARVTALITAEDYDRDGQLKHPFHQESFSEIESAQSALLAVGIWSYWSTVQQRDYLIFNKSFPILWLRRLQHRVLKGALEFGIAMPVNLQSQAIALGLAKSDVELLQKTIAHFVEVNVQLRASGLTHDDLWENWEKLLIQLDELGIDADEEVEQLALQAMQRVGIDHEFESESETDSYTMLPDPVSIDESLDDDSDLEEFGVDDIVDEVDIFDGDMSSRKEDTAISADPAPLNHLDSGDESEPLSDEDSESIELISEEFIDDDQLADEGDSLLLLDDADIVDEEILDAKTAELGDLLLAERLQTTQVLVSSPEPEVLNATSPQGD